MPLFSCNYQWKFLVSETVFLSFLLRPWVIFRERVVWEKNVSSILFATNFAPLRQPQTNQNAKNPTQCAMLCGIVNIPQCAMIQVTWCLLVIIQNPYVGSKNSINRHRYKFLRDFTFKWFVSDANAMRSIKTEILLVGKMNLYFTSTLWKYCFLCFRKSRRWKNIGNGGRGCVMHYGEVYSIFREFEAYFMNGIRWNISLGTIWTNMIGTTNARRTADSARPEPGAFPLVYKKTVLNTKSRLSVYDPEVNVQNLLRVNNREWIIS